MNNLSYSESAFTKVKSEGVKTTQTSEKKISQENAVSVMNESQKAIASLGEMLQKFYEAYPTNEISTALNSLEMVSLSVQKLDEKVKVFGL